MNKMRERENKRALAGARNTAAAAAAASAATAAASEAEREAAGAEATAARTRAARVCTRTFATHKQEGRRASKPDSISNYGGGGGRH